MSVCKEADGNSLGVTDSLRYFFTIDAMVENFKMNCLCDSKSLSDYQVLIISHKQKSIFMGKHCNCNSYSHSHKNKSDNIENIFLNENQIYQIILNQINNKCFIAEQFGRKT